MGLADPLALASCPRGAAGVRTAPRDLLFGKEGGRVSRVTVRQCDICLRTMEEGPSEGQVVIVVGVLPSSGTRWASWSLDICRECQHRIGDPLPKRIARCVAPSSLAALRTQLAQDIAAAYLAAASEER